jgi:hypothetical protein
VGHASTRAKVGASYYGWKVPGQPSSIQIGLNVIGEIEAAIVRQFRTPPQRSPEVGGVLFGHIVAGEAAIYIDDYSPVECEYLRGSSYVLSGPDRRRLERTLRKGSRERRVVGFYRSHTRVGSYLDQDDYSLIQNYFSNPNYVFLLVRPSTDGALTGGFFFWEEDSLRRHSTYLEFPFHTAQIEKRDDSREPVAAAPRPPAPAAASPLAPAVPRWPPPARPRPAWLRTAAMAALLLASLAAAEYRVLKFSPPHPSAGAASNVSPAMWVTRQGEYLQVSWRYDAASIASARRGMLIITDGGHRKAIQLDRKQLTTAGVAYRPFGNDVGFRLELTGSNAIVSEALRWQEAPCQVAGPTHALASRPGVPRTHSRPWHDDGL